MLPLFWLLMVHGHQHNYTNISHNQSHHHNLTQHYNHTQHHNHNLTLPEPHDDVISILIRQNWTDVCHHARFYLSQFCSILNANPLEECEAIPLKVGNLLCVRGICLCMGGFNTQGDTALVARVRHRALWANDTAWPDWIGAVEVVHFHESPPLYVFALCAAILLMTLFVATCLMRIYRRYMGYKRVEPPKE